MTREKVLFTVLILILFLVLIFNFKGFDNGSNLEFVIDADVSAHEIEIIDFKLFPGSQKQYVVTANSSVDSSYRLNISFIAVSDEGLMNHLQIKIVVDNDELVFSNPEKLSGEQLITTTLAMLVDQPTDFNVIFKISSEAGNEIQGKSSNFKLKFEFIRED